MLPQQDLLLEFGGGPVIYPLISARNRVKKIVFADFLAGNLAEVRLWVEDSPKAFSWDHLFKYVATLENSRDSLEQMKNQLRERFSGFISCDAFAKSPISEQLPAPPSIVSVNFCPESICESKTEFHQAFMNISSLVAAGSYLVFCCLAESKAWLSDKKKFCCYPVTAQELRETLESAGFSIVEFRTATAVGGNDYEGLLASLSQRK